LRRRGFDHAELIARHFARIAGLDCLGLFARPKAKDQRRLTRQERIRNMGSRFSLAGIHGLGQGLGQGLGHDMFPATVLLVDDVYTTGASLIAAARTLKDAGVSRVYCVTFARTW
jgi:predicted amidophosphoribosyltransferase